MYKTLAYLFAILALQGCVSGVTHTPLNPQNAASIKQANLYNLVIQDEIRPAVDISNVSGALGGGLIGAVIDSSINKSRNRSAQEVMAGFYGATDDFDFRQLQSADLNSAVASVLPLKVKEAPAEFILLNNTEQNKRIAALGEGEAMVYTSTFYSFVDQSREFVTESVVFIYTKPAKPSKNPKPIYFNRFVYVSGTKGTGGDTSIAQWSENNAKAFREEMAKSTSAIGEMIAMDIKSHTNMYCGKPVKAGLIYGGQKIQGNATLVSEKGGANWVQDASGAIYSVPASTVTANAKAKAKAKPAKCG